MAVRRRAFEYRSQQVWGTLPVVHVAVGGRQADGRYRPGRARGVIALGDIATGLVAVGGLAIGLFSVGGVAIGLAAMGGVAIALVAVGGVAVGLVAIGAVAMGLTAVGALTVGLVAAGPSHRLAQMGRELRAQDGDRRGGGRDANLQAPMEHDL